MKKNFVNLEISTKKTNENMPKNTTNQYLNQENPITDAQKRYLPIKRALDIVASGISVIALSPILASLTIAIKIDTPGPVLFKQKRVGKNKSYFDILKFRTMRVDTPKDMPTHLLNDPDQYITKVGKFLRKTSLDELPQIINILVGEMSFIGPRPALWNQEDLILERDKYGVNSLIPGLTGWAQINGRDELEIPVKAKLDGDYVKQMGPVMDAKCFLGTIGSVLSRDGVVEGGTGELKKTGYNTNGIMSEEKLNKQIKTGAKVLGITGAIGFLCLASFKKNDHNSGRKNIKTGGMYKRGLTAASIGTAIIAGIGLYKRSQCKKDIYRALAKPTKIMRNEIKSNIVQSVKKILITGANSYIGTSVENWLNKTPNLYDITTLDMIGDTWKEHDFSKYDVVFHVAGIAHNDIGHINDDEKELYYDINTQLAIDVAQKSKTAGVKQFIFMSSMIIYSGCSENTITEKTKPKPLNFYGDSKWQADREIRLLSDDVFKVVALRPPMIYGKASKGNYKELSKIAKKLPVFPEVKNKRSMLYIDNLCEFVKLVIDNQDCGIFFPQNSEYTNTSEMVKMIASVVDHNIITIPYMDRPVKLLSKIPGKIGVLANKAFGSLCYDLEMSKYANGDYQLFSLIESIQMTEGV